MTAEPKGRAAEAGRAVGGGGVAEIICRQEEQLSNKNGAYGTVIGIVLVLFFTKTENY